MKNTGRLFGLLLSSLLVLVFCSTPQTTTRTVIITHASHPVQFTDRIRDKEAARFLVLINQYRKQNKRGPLAQDPRLRQAAQWMSEDMAQHNYTSHQDSLGRDPFARINHFGYAYNTYKAENVAAGHPTAQAAFDGWKKSPRHNANMLNLNFRFIGIGFAYHKNSEYGWYWATTFGGEKNPALQSR